jgi:TusA-related sulfurtransferase
MSKKRKIDQVLNIVGFLQPQSNFLVSKTLEKVEKGGVVEVISNEKNSMKIMTGLCPKRKYKITETREISGLFHYTIMKN